MAGLWGAHSARGWGRVELESVDNSLDPLGIGVWRSHSDDCSQLACCWPAAGEFSGRWFHNRADLAAALYGELTTPSFDAALVERLAADDPCRTAAALRGTWVVALLNKRNGRLRIISDRTSQQPVFWLELPGGLVFSTSMATFCRLPSAPGLDPGWLYEFLYFNYPLSHRTFLQDVRRMPAATVLDYDPRDTRVTLRSYAPLHDVPPTLLDEQESVAETRAVLSEVVRRSIDSPETAAISLTCGMDSRTLLSCVPRDYLPKMHGFTYGRRGSLDFDMGRSMSASLGLRHVGTAFDDEFRDTLPELLWWTVFLSGGLQGVLRSTLPYAYCDFARRCPEVGDLLHGAAGDHLYRDHVQGSGNVPHILSPGLHASIHQGAATVEGGRFRELVGRRYDEFTETVKRGLEQLVTTYGPLGDPVAYVRLLLYEAGPKYFAGESSIAGHWFRLRRPYMNAEVVEAALCSPYGVAALSRRMATQDRFRERYFQARLVSFSPEVSRLPLYDRPLAVYMRASPLAYHLYSLRLLPRRIVEKLRPRRPTLEDWPTWTGMDLEAHWTTLFDDTSRLGDYLSLSAIRQVMSTGDLELVGKFLTAEILLRLVDSRWQLPDRCHRWQRPVAFGRSGGDCRPERPVD